MASRMSTGIRVVDNFLGGGLRKGDSVLIRSSPFIDAAPLAYELLLNHLNGGNQALYFVNNKPPDAVLDEIGDFGWEAKRFLETGDLKFIDAYTGLLGLKGSSPLFVENPSDTEGVSRVVQDAFKKGGKETVAFFDSLNTLIDQCGLNVLSHIKEWCKYGLTYDVSSVYLYTEWGYPETARLRTEKIFDTIVDLKALKRIVASEVITVTKLGKKQVEERKFVSFRYVKPGGLQVYVPKILITGSYHAGKTTVVHKLSSRAVSVQRMGTTVALDFGHVDHEGFSVDLFGTIGQTRFDPILGMLGSKALGVLLVVDSTKPEEFPRAVEMMKKAGVHGLPYVVLANKQDLPGALGMKEIREKMHIPNDVSVIGTVATESKNIVKALEMLLNKLVRES